MERWKMRAKLPSSVWPIEQNSLGGEPMKRFVMLIAICLLTTACQSRNDNGITRLDNCVCYTSSKGQTLQASQMAWQDPETLQEQFSHCVCRALIDLKKIDDPSKLFVPGTEIRTELK
jgi:hypothetical protein